MIHLTIGENEMECMVEQIQRDLDCQPQSFINRTIRDRKQVME